MKFIKAIGCILAGILLLTSLFACAEKETLNEAESESSEEYKECNLGNVMISNSSDDLILLLATQYPSGELYVNDKTYDSISDEDGLTFEVPLDEIPHNILQRIQIDLYNESGDIQEKIALSNFCISTDADIEEGCTYAYLYNYQENELPDFVSDKLRGLYVYSDGTVQIDTLSQFTNLETLQFFAETSDDDLSSLASLTELKDLTLSSESIQGNLNDLGQLINLTTLNIFYTDGLTGGIEELSGLTSLTSLALESCEGITGDISELASLIHLESLSIDSCANINGDISDLNVLDSLETLNIESENISGDLQSIDMPNLISLTLSGNNISGNVDELSDISQLKRLDLNSENIGGDISALKTLGNLSELCLSYCEGLEGEASGLSTFTNLSTLELRMCDGIVGDIGSFGEMTELETLIIDSCEKITGNIEDLSGLINLKHLFINCLVISGDVTITMGTGGSSVTSEGFKNISGDISVLTDLDSLESISLWYCYGIKGEVSDLSSMPNLKSLILMTCPNLSGDIGELDNLQSLYVSDCSGLSGTLTLPNGTVVSTEQ